MAWDTSDRRHRLPPNWAATVRRIKQRDHGLCQAVAHHPACNGIGTEVDHIVAGDNHDDSNLQLLSRECHAEKTIRDNRDLRARRTAERCAPREPHPGTILNTG